MRGTNRDAGQVNVRLPEGMRDRLKERARENMRSLNAEIVFVLTHAVQRAETEKGKTAA